MTKIKTLEGHVDEAEAAKIIRYSQQTLRRWRMQGCGPVFVKRGAGKYSISYRLADLVKFNMQNARVQTSTAEGKK